MIKIYTIYKLGQTIPHKVLEGVVSQTVECCLVPITQTKGGTARLNSVNNWISALEFRTDEVFFGMDGDVVMDDPKTIEKLLFAVQPVFMATIRTQIIQHRSKLAHALFACNEPEVLRKELISIRKNWTGKCSMCTAISNLAQKGKKTRIILTPRAYECTRETLKRNRAT
ncbi:MAG: hypothetical protein FVQ79_10870 [Planctomycetes bacterium]|nr:hypothetical protein [Planctomycetota bacterium]